MEIKQMPPVEPFSQKPNGVIPSTNVPPVTVGNGWPPPAKK
jgi:hypothetical protein